MTDAAPWSLAEHAPLQALNTFHVRAHAPRLLRVADPTALPEVLPTIGDGLIANPSAQALNAWVGFAPSTPMSEATGALS